MPDRLTRALAVAVVVAAVGLVGFVGPTAAGAQPSVAVAGDSIADRSRIQVRHAVEPTHPIVWYETFNSATIKKLGPPLLREVSRPNGPDIVLVELGTGNAFWGTSPTLFRQQVRELTAGLLRHATCVRWFEQKPGGNLAYPSINRQAVAFNRILREVVNSFPRARTVHYEAWTRLAGDAVFQADLLHLNQRGKNGLARLAAQAVTGCDPALRTGPYWDVADRHWAAEAVRWVADHHYIDGYANDTFRLDVGGIAPALDRLDWVQALWRRAGRPGVGPPAPWPDTPDAGAGALAWAADAHIVGGVPGAPFRPALSVTRGDALRWLHRAEGTPSPAPYPPHGLVDVPPGLDPVARWAKGVGVLTVPDGGRLRPEDPLTRADAAVFLHRVDQARSP